MWLLIWAILPEAVTIVRFTKNKSRGQMVHERLKWIIIGPKVRQLGCRPFVLIFTWYGGFTLAQE
jgi:hypothetical protein